MEKTKLILFDCMETLIDMTELPSPKDYALWAFAGSGYEYLWKDFHEFYEGYKLTAQTIKSELPIYKEYDMKLRFEGALNILEDYGKCNFGDREAKNSLKKADVLEALCLNYWKNYENRCFASQEVKELLGLLYGKFHLGVVSNFMVPNGIERILEKEGIAGYFDFVVTSIGFGYRKPCEKIYEEALGIAGVKAEDVIFIGDDFECDYVEPRKLGMKAIFYDKRDEHKEADDRVLQLGEIRDIMF